LIAHLRAQSPPALPLFEQVDEFLAEHDTMLSKFVAASDCGRVIRLVTLGIYALAKPVRSAADDDPMPDSAARATSQRKLGERHVSEADRRQGGQVQFAPMVAPGADRIDTVDA
jgi:hypothetical protein